MTFEIKGLGELQNKLKNLQSEIEKLSGEKKVSFKDVFPTSFMRKFTQFALIDEMINKSPFKVENEEDFKKIPDEAWDAYVREKTSFKSWAEMQSKAAEEYLGKKVQEATNKL